MFNQDSYEKHSHWYNQQFPTQVSKFDHLTKMSNHKPSIGKWLQHLFFNCLSPLLKQENNTWLTIGDAYGLDAQYLKNKGNKVVASDLNADFLSLSKEKGIIDAYAVQNAESLNYLENSFDYILCKESYHHFPRPYAALYEMIRVAKKGMVIMEPQDPVLQMPLLLALNNLLSGLSQKLTQRLWKNRFSHEPVGNFVYKISARELEKFAAGLNLPAIAIKKINPNFYFEGANDCPAKRHNMAFIKILIKKNLIDFLTKLGIIPAQVLSAIIFKTPPEPKLLADLKKSGYQLIVIPSNPYL